MYIFSYICLYEYAYTYEGEMMAHRIGTAPTTDETNPDIRVTNIRTSGTQDSDKFDPNIRDPNILDSGENNTEKTQNQCVDDSRNSCGEASDFEVRETILIYIDMKIYPK
jgi:hypothetical protein